MGVCVCVRVFQALFINMSCRPDNRARVSSASHGCNRLCPLRREGVCMCVLTALCSAPRARCVRSYLCMCFHRDSGYPGWHNQDSQEPRQSKGWVRGGRGPRQGQGTRPGQGWTRPSPAARRRRRRRFRSRWWRSRCRWLTGPCRSHECMHICTDAHTSVQRHTNQCVTHQCVTHLYTGARHGRHTVATHV